MISQVKKRIRMHVSGRVQGVGFRPTVFRHALSHALSGFVKNTPSGVVIEAEGSEADISNFVDKLKTTPPRQANIESIRIEEIHLSCNPEPFKIISSSKSGNLRAGMPPDLATCEECRAELFDPANRRYHYPFINCTNCGPRFTIIRELPYDRDKTSMANFKMCSECDAEYRQPLNRRFDAQPNACQDCGPTVQLITSDGIQISGDPFDESAKRLKNNGILAVKGIGGFHLCCDAISDQAIARLRTRKTRPVKSLAVMFASLDDIRQHCEINDDEAKALSCCASPIVIIRRRQSSTLSRLISPDTNDVGVFLPYSPLHHFLLSKISPLVMTSGNLADEPIAKDEENLKKLLGTIADSALIHNRPIVRRCDDSVLKIIMGKRLFFRRSRGIVPDPIQLQSDGPPILACGADLKNTICVTRGRHAFLSQHIGDLENYRTNQFFCELIDDFTQLLRVQPAIIAHDLHPDYLSTRYAMAAGNVTRIAIQHHHAHIAACMTEHHLTEPVIGVALDGTGFGPDHTVWGGEFLVADLKTWRRAAFFKQYRMPGGEEAIRNPVRMALSYALTELNSESIHGLHNLLPVLSDNDFNTLNHMIKTGIHSPLTSSAGRLFDAVAALLGINEPICYEGQAAIRLQTMADPSIESKYHYEMKQHNDCMVVSFGPMIQDIVTDIRSGVDRSRIAGQFHNTVAAAIASVCSMIRNFEHLNKVALSGGVFQNDLLLERATNFLIRNGFQVYSHHQVPPNDGGIALGQAAIAMARVTMVGTKAQSNKGTKLKKSEENGVVSKK